MAYTSEIEKLERRHKENPDGRYFAPLADNYRKAGEVPRALELLKAGLQLHPGYVSAHIVLGRCHLDQNDLPAADAAFRQVLELDKENVIAIKALAEIAERQHRFAESEEWLNYLLSIDGSNDDARLQLTRIGIIREQFEKNAVPEEVLTGERPVAVPEMKEDVPPALATPEPAVEAPAPDLEEPTVEIPPAPPEPVTMPEPFAARSLDALQSMTTEEVDALDEAFDMVEALPTPPVVADEAPPQPEVPEPAVDAPESAADEGFVVGVEKHEEIVLRPSSTSEYQVPSDAELLGGSRPSGGFSAFEEDLPSPGESGAAAETKSDDTPDALSESPWGDSAVREEWSPHAVLMEPETAEPALPAEVPEADTPEMAGPDAPDEAAGARAEAPVPEPEEPEPVALEAPVEGETPAEPAHLSLDQAAGSPAEPGEGMAPAPVAADAAPEEPAPPPEPPAPLPEASPMLTETMAEVYAAQGHHADALEVYRELSLRNPDDERLRARVAELENRLRANRGRSGYAAADTGGTSVLAYFGDLLSTRLGEVPDNGHPLDDASAAPPDDPGPMDEAFADADPPLGGEPTRPANEPLSLSAIFGEDSSPIPPAIAGPDAGETGRRAGSSYDEFFGEPPAESSGGRTRTIRMSDADQDDLDQFHKWLKGLKR